MSVGLRIVGSVNSGEVDSSGQQRVILYDSAGNVLNPVNRAAIVATAGGILNLGADYKVARSFRVDETGTLRSTSESLFLYDGCEGAAIDTNKWLSTVTTSTITQAAATGILLNAGSSVAINTGAMITSQRKMPKLLGGPLLARFRVRATAHFANGLIEVGFGNPASAITALFGDGAIWRKDSAGQWLPVISVNSVEALGTPISNATFIAAIATTEYAIFTVELHAAYARFCIYKQDGSLVTSQDMDWTAGANFASLAVTHVNILARQWNSGATGTAVQAFIDEVMCTALDVMHQRPYDVSQSGMHYNSLTSPTAYSQNANYANSAAPASAALSNTAAGYTNLGGQFQFAMVAGAETDYALFGFTNPSPYSLYVRGISITTWNTGAVSGTNASLFQWGYAANSSAVSLATGAPNPPMRGVIGAQGMLTGTPIGDMANPPTLQRLFQTPISVDPGKLFHIILKVQLGTATASQIIRGVCDIDGFFE